MDFQQIIFTGNAVDKAKIQKLEGKVPFADAVIATSRNQDEADFIPVRMFDKQTAIAAMIEKGTKVLVTGRLEMRKFTPKGADESRLYVRVLASNLLLLGKNQQGRNEEGKKPDKRQA
jgi:single-stranded DNA-binding protein